jgi:hypothetical protein
VILGVGVLVSTNDVVCEGVAENVELCVCDRLGDCDMEGVPLTVAIPLADCV